MDGEASAPRVGSAGFHAGWPGSPAAVAPAASQLELASWQMTSVVSFLDVLTCLVLFFFVLFCFVLFFILFFFCLFFAISWAAPAAYGGSQARG